MDGYHFEIAQSRRIAKFRPFIRTPEGNILYEDFFPKRRQALESLIKHLNSINDFRRFQGEAELDISVPEGPKAAEKAQKGTPEASKGTAEVSGTPAKSGTPSAPEKPETRPAKVPGKAESVPEALPESTPPAKTPKKAKVEAKSAGKAVTPAKAAIPETETQTPEQRADDEIQRKTAQSAAPRGTDFAFPEGGLQLPNGEKSRAKANLAAIGLLRQLESEQRPATADEQTTLSRFVGWGGLSNIFDESKPEWAALRTQLKNTLSDEEYAAAAKSTLNAHYTSQEVIEGVYAALEHMGFRGGRLLEPSAGIGHFAGAMPANLRGKSRWTMVELEPVTGGIAKQLYPNADVRVQGFESVLLPDDYFDAAISNVPFGDIRVHDPAYKPYLTKSIHNYFFAKALDKVRPGGVVAFVTSRYTMDSTQAGAVRRYLSTKADLLGAVRLPDTAFKSNAGTDVVTDILIFKKRAPGTPPSGEKFAEVAYKSYMGAKGYAQGYVNEYFLNHPEMVLGTPDMGKMYGDSLTWHPLDTDKSLKEQITEAFSTVTGTMEYPVSRTQADIKAEIQGARRRTGQEGRQNLPQRGRGTRRGRRRSEEVTGGCRADSVHPGRRAGATQFPAGRRAPKTD